jgi:ligand-binding sensor domain-containing protein
VGHVFSLDGGTVQNLSGDLIDAPADSVMVARDGALVVGTDFGAWVSRNQDGHWARMGTNLPNVPVLQLSPTPDGQILAATHGRGCWTIREP